MYLSIGYSLMNLLWYLRRFLCNTPLVDLLCVTSNCSTTIWLALEICYVHSSCAMIHLFYCCKPASIGITVWFFHLLCLGTATSKFAVWFFHIVIRFVSTSAKFGFCNVVRLKGTLVEDKMRTFKRECDHFSFNKYPI
jgi:hypothetical protein